MRMEGRSNDKKSKMKWKKNKREKRNCWFTIQIALLCVCIEIYMLQTSDHDDPLKQHKHVWLITHWLYGWLIKQPGRIDDDNYLLLFILFRFCESLRSGNSSRTYVGNSKLNKKIIFINIQHRITIAYLRVNLIQEKQIEWVQIAWISSWKFF